MKKFLSLFLSLAMMAAMVVMPTAVSADTASDLFLWSSPALGETFTDGTRTIERVYDEVTGSYAAKITAASGWNLLRYTVPASKLTEGHTYTAECYIRTEVGANNWLGIDFAGQTDTPYTPQWTSGKVYKKTGLNLASNRNLSIGLANTGATVIYIDNLIVYDEADETKTNLVVNGDFEKTQANFATMTGADAFPNWTSPALGETFTDGTRTIERIYDKTTQSYVAKITAASGWNLLGYTVPASKLTEGHTYTAECYIRTEVGADNWLGIDFAGQTDTPYTPQWTSGKVYKKTGLNLASNRALKIGLANTGATVIYVDNLVVYDEADETKTNLVVNGDFEKIQRDYDEVRSGSFAFPNWISPAMGETFTDGTRKIERIYDKTTQSYVAKITAASGWNLLRYTIPENKLTDGHTYTVECYMRTEVGENNYLAIDFAGQVNTPYTPQWTSGGVYKKTGLKIPTSNRNLSFGLVNTGATVIYIDNLVVYDEADETKTNLVVNGDFETYIPEFSVKFSKDDTAVYANIVNETEDDLSITLISAAYVGNKLYSCTAETKNIEKKFANQEIKTNLPDLPQEGEYTIRAFAWNNKDMTPYKATEL